MLCPVLTPAELWERTGRIAIPQVIKLQDGTGRPFVLPLSHEETMTFHAREIQLVQGAAADSGTTSRRRSATSHGRAAGYFASASSS